MRRWQKQRPRADAVQDPRVSAGCRIENSIKKMIDAKCDAEHKTQSQMIRELVIKGLGIPDPMINYDAD
jgi:hypothetical protein